MQTFTDLYRKNTLNFEFKYKDTPIIEDHKVSYKTMQTLGKVMTNMSVSADGEIVAQDLIQTTMGRPSEKTKVAVLAGFGKRYDVNELQKIVANEIREEGEVPEEEVVEATIVVVRALEDAIVSDLFNVYLENQQLDSDTPRG